MRRLSILVLAAIFGTGVSAQTITTVSPGAAPQGIQGLAVQISGTNLNFSQATGTSLDVYFMQASSTYLPGYSSVVTGPNSVLTYLDIPFTTATGLYELFVNSGGNLVSLNSAFTVTAGAQPQIVSVDTNYAAAGTTLDVTISGLNTHFQSGSNTSVWFYQASSTIYPGSTIYPNSVTALSATQLVANVSLYSGQNFGFYDVVVSDYFDNTVTLPNGFIVTDTSVGIITVSSTGYAQLGDSATLIITAAGTHFGAVGDTVTVWLGDVHRSSVTNILPVRVVVLSATQLSATFAFPAGTQTGYYDVFVLNHTDGELTKARGFNLVATGITGPDPDKVSVYPNPVRDALTLKVTTPMIGSSYTLTDLSGRTMLSGVADSRVSTVPTSGLASGLYMLRIGGLSYKIVKD